MPYAPSGSKRKSNKKKNEEEERRRNVDIHTRMCPNLSDYT
jgi:hypothetical protein